VIFQKSTSEMPSRIHFYLNLWDDSDAPVTGTGEEGDKQFLPNHERNDLRTRTACVLRPLFQSIRRKYTMEPFKGLDKLSDVFIFWHCSRGFILREFCILLTQ